MPEVAQKRETCFGCCFSRYEGPASVAGKRETMGGTAIPLRESDARNGPGRYGCAKYHLEVARGDETPRELRPGCKERR